MENLLINIFKASLTSSMMFGFYLLVLRKSTHFSLNRIFLLFTILFPIALLLVDFKIPIHEQQSNYSAVLSSIVVGQENISQRIIRFTPWSIATWIYLSGLFLMTFRFVFNIFKIIRLIHNCKKSNILGIKVYYTKEKLSPFSFFGKIILPDGENNLEALKKILSHERVHVVQNHSLDTFLAELFCIINWFNPLARLIKKSMIVTHEYLADKSVLEHNAALSEYSLLLIQQTVGIHNGLVNNFHNSLTLKRINMMRKKRSGKFSGLKILLAVPLVLFFVVALSCNHENVEKAPEFEQSNLQTENFTKPGGPVTANPIFSEVDKMPEFPGGQEKLYEFMGKNVKYPQEAKEKGYTGKVFVEFTVLNSGKLSDIKVIKGAHPLLDQEALRVVSSMPDWTPGQHKGKAVDVKMTLPIAFKLDEKKK